MSVAGLSAAALAAAYVSQYGFGLMPCELCLWQRWPHWAAIAFALAGAMARGRVGAFLLTAAALSLLAGAGIAGFHVGVEQKWWAGLASCGGAVSSAGSLDALRAELLGRAPVRCDEPAFVLAGISMAGWNGLLSLAIAGLAFVSGRAMLKRRPMS